MPRVDHNAVAALLRASVGEPTLDDAALLRGAGLLHDYSYYDTPAQKTVTSRDTLTAEGQQLAWAISDARAKEQALRQRLDAIAAEMDRAWQGSRSEYAPMSNVATHPAWKQYSAELKRAAAARQKAEAAASKRIVATAKQRHRYGR